MWSLCCVTAGMWARAAPHTLTRGAVWSGSAHSPLSVRLNWGYSMRNAFALLLICRTVIQPGITSASYRFLRSILDFRRQKIAERIPLWQLRLWRALVSSLALWNGWRDAAVTVADAKRLKTVGSRTGKRVWDRTTLIVQGYLKEEEIWRFIFRWDIILQPVVLWAEKCLSFLQLHEL